MKNKIISILVIFLIVFSSLSVYAEDIIVQNFDIDDDKVCDLPERDLMRLLSIDPEDGNAKSELNRHLTGTKRCIPTKYGDRVCPNTPKGQSVDTTSDSETSGCSISELKDYYNYWSVDLKEIRPKRVKLNWLIDQQYGVDVFQPLEFIPNVVAEREEGEVELEIPRFFCYSVKTNELGEKIRTGYLRSIIPHYQSDNKREVVLRLTLNRFSEDQLTEENILKIFDRRTIYGAECENEKKFGRSCDLDGIEIYCKSEVYSCKNRVDENERVKCERLRGPPEVDEFYIFVPFERLVFHPPEAALEAGAQLAGNIISVLEYLLPNLEKVSKFSRDACYSGIGLKILGEFVRPFYEPISNLIDAIWRGKGYSDNLEGGLIGFKAFCRYYACPREWCWLTNNKDFSKVEETTSEAEKRWKNSNLPIQDSLVLSSGCLCFSGIYMNLLKLKVILQEWERCLEAARVSEQYSVYCEKYLSKYLCEEIIGEFMAFSGENGVLSKIFSKVRYFVKKLPVVRDVKDYLQARKNVEGVTGIIGNIGQFSNELSPIATADVKGNLGYREGTPQLICEYAFYQKIPQFDLFERFKIQPIKWTTTILGNWNSKVAYLGLDEEKDAVYEYEISWTIIAGNDNFRYRVYLEREGGGSFPINGRRYEVNNEEGSYIVRTSDGTLRRAGDLVADYVEIILDGQYDKLCFYVPSEANEKRCFPAGSFSVGDPLGGGIFDKEEIEDSDGDGLRDEWEKRFNCMAGREEYENELDKKACEELLNKNENNILNPNNPDSDGDRIRDGEENPDGDAFTNYYEQQNSFHPNSANKDLNGEDIDADCYGKLSDEDTILITNEVLGDKYLYSAGDYVKIKADWLDTNEENVLLMGEIKNTDINNPYYDVKSVALKGLNKNEQINLLQLKDNIKSGVYLFKIYLVTIGDLRFEKCTDPKTGKLASKEFYLIVQNPSEEGCIDSDNGINYGVDGVCIDFSSINSDSCSNNGLKEWYCKDNKCEFKTKDCGDTGFCNKGKCKFDNCVDNDPDNNFGFPGICKYRKDGGGNLIEKGDFCLDGTYLLQYSCVLGECKEGDAEMCLTGLACYEERNKPAVCK